MTTSRRLAAILLGLALVAGPAAATIFGSETSVDAGMTSPWAAEAAAGTVVVRNDRRLAPSSGGAVHVRAGSGGSPTSSNVVLSSASAKTHSRVIDPSAPVPGERQLSDGGAVVGGLASYVARSYGSRYLALPGGPGIRVTICAKRCVTRTSTDAGPSLAMQRQGRVADVSWADFRYICRCSPEAVGLIVVSVQYAELPSTDTIR